MGGPDPGAAEGDRRHDQVRRAHVDAGAARDFERTGPAGTSSAPPGSSTTSSAATRCWATTPRWPTCSSSEDARSGSCAGSTGRGAEPVHGGDERLTGKDVPRIATGAPHRHVRAGLRRVPVELVETRDWAQVEARRDGPSGQDADGHRPRAERSRAPHRAGARCGASRRSGRCSATRSGSASSSTRRAARPVRPAHRPRAVGRGPAHALQGREAPGSPLAAVPARERAAAVWVLRLAMLSVRRARPRPACASTTAAWDVAPVRPSASSRTSRARPSTRGAGVLRAGRARRGGHRRRSSPASVTGDWPSWTRGSRRPARGARRRRGARAAGRVDARRAGAGRVAAVVAPAEREDRPRPTSTRCWPSGSRSRPRSTWLTPRAVRRAHHRAPCSGRR